MLFRSAEPPPDESSHAQGANFVPAEPDPSGDEQQVEQAPEEDPPKVKHDPLSEAKRRLKGL